MEFSTPLRPSRPRAGSAFRSILPSAAVLLFLGLPVVADAQVETLPPMPAIEPGPDLDVHGFENDGTFNDPDYVFTQPYIPPTSNSLDYRIGLMRKIVDHDLTPGTPWRPKLFLYAPEKLVDTNGDPIPFMDTADGAEIVGDIDTSIEVADLHDSVNTPLVEYDYSHLALCDPRASQNPTVCSGSDCYDLHVVTGLIKKTYQDANSDGQPDLDGNGNKIQAKRDLKLWSVPVTIEVSDPKTAQAQIASVTVGSTPVEGALIEGAPAGTALGFGSFHTPLIVGDNRLLVARVSGRFTWDQAGTPTTGIWDGVYSYYSGGSECDVTQWDEFKPLAYASADSAVSSQFGFAKYPMRSPSGKTVPTTADFRGRYLWMDQDANNLFFGSVHRDLLDISGTTDLYDTRCLSGIACEPPTTPISDSQRGGDHQGWMMMGLWTHGKMVMLDSTINHADFGIRGREENHREVALYCADTDYADCTQTGDTQHWVRVGSGQHEVALVDKVAPIVDSNPYGWIDTTVQLHSPEHFFNVLPQMRPGTPRDVVWHVTTGTRTDEVAFDDYISHRTLVFSPMNGLKEMVGTTAAELAYFDGNDPNAPGDMRLQNAATTLKWEPPAYGEVHAADAKSGRIENVALGGVKARGFFLFEDSGIEYDIPDVTENQTLDGKDWMVSIFYDRRKDPVGTLKRLFTFPSGAHVKTHGVTKLKLCPAPNISGLCPTNVTLPKGLVTATWTHLALHFEESTDKIHLYQDGFLFATVDRPAGMEIESGSFWVGSHDSGTTPGIEGWIDDFKIVEGPFSPEEICNHARGTLVSIPYDSTSDLRDLWTPFDTIPDVPGTPSTYREPGRVAVHEALHGSGAVVWPLSDLYVCSIDYTSPKGMSLHDPGQGDPDARSLRRRLLFPEGPVVWNAPRPDSSANGFCLSCHHPDEEGGLTLAALTRDNTTDAYLDARRQPMQVPETVFGLIPAHHVAEDKPPFDLTPTNGTNLDAYLDDGPLYRWTFDETGGTPMPNWVIGDPDAGPTGATRMNGVVYQQGKNHAHALAFDGVDDYARVDSKFDLTGSAMTVSAWLRLGSGAATSCEDSSSGSRCVLLAKSGTSDHWLLEVYKVDGTSTWRARFQVSTVSASPRELEVDLPGTFAISQWHHLVGRYDDGDLELFLDGVSIGTGTGSASDLATAPSLYVTIGARLDSVNAPQDVFEGRIDDPRIWDRALLDGEIEALHAGTP